MRVEAGDKGGRSWRKKEKKVVVAQSGGMVEVEAIDLGYEDGMRKSDRFGGCCLQ